MYARIQPPNKINGKYVSMLRRWFFVVVVVVIADALEFRWDMGLICVRHPIRSYDFPLFSLLFFPIHSLTESETHMVRCKPVYMMFVQHGISAVSMRFRRRRAFETKQFYCASALHRCALAKEAFGTCATAGQSCQRAFSPLFEYKHSPWPWLCVCCMLFHANQIYDPTAEDDATPTARNRRVYFISCCQTVDRTKRLFRIVFATQWSQLSNFTRGLNTTHAAVSCILGTCVCDGKG